MSVQFGRWNLDGTAIENGYIAKARSLLAHYAPDAYGCYAAGNASILYHALHTTRESIRENQPHVIESGVVMTWDGRLDDRAELIGRLGQGLTPDSTDLEIVAEAYRQWHTNCFSELIGDWALAIWNSKDECLLLARDIAGVRQLYYSTQKDWIVWSTILDPLVLLSETSVALCEEYIAGWLSSSPAAYLTPYIGIHAVPPASFITLRSKSQTITRYWEFSSSKRIRYRTDNEYDEHFRTVFRQAISADCGRRTLFWLSLAAGWTPRQSFAWRIS